jgi:hypothetical protein
VPVWLGKTRRKTMDYFYSTSVIDYLDDFLADEIYPEVEDEELEKMRAEMIAVTREVWFS